jgi:CVNH domain
MQRIVLGLAAACSLSLASLAPAAAQYYGGGAPSGSYQQSCTNIRVSGGQLSARCTAPNGSRMRSSIALGSCRGGDIANTNGQLTCNGGYNNGYGYGRERDGRYRRDNGYGNNYGNGYAPGGSYQGSCTNIQMNGNVLTANCSAANGARVTSSINANRCRGGDIANVNGRLQCR